MIDDEMCGKDTQLEEVRNSSKNLTGRCDGDTSRGRQSADGRIMLKWIVI
jgi:hypothetical protein